MTLETWYHSCFGNLWVEGTEAVNDDVNEDGEGGNNDVIKWKHFLRYWPFVRGIHRSPMDSPHKGQWSGALVFHLMCATNKHVEQAIKMPVIWDTVALIVTSL